MDRPGGDKRGTEPRHEILVGQFGNRFGIPAGVYSGYRRLHAVLEREGWHANHKLIARLYQEERLAIRRRHRQKRGAGTMSGHWCPIAANQRWSMDFTPPHAAGCTGTPARRTPWPAAASSAPPTSRTTAPANARRSSSISRYRGAASL